MQSAKQSELPLRADYGEGAYRRRIHLRTEGPGAEPSEGGAETRALLAELEDSFHHFAVRLEHDAARVTALRGVAARHPWTTCPGAVKPLERLRGMPLTRSQRTIARRADPRVQCTHLLDLAALAIAAAAAGIAERAYDVEVPDRTGRDASAALHRDGALLFEWKIEGITITAPEPFAGKAIAGGGFGAWCEAALDPDTAEAAQVLRRATMIALGRQYDFDRIERAAQFADMAGGNCHAFSPAFVEQGRRVAGSTRDFASAEELLASPILLPKTPARTQAR